MLQDKDCGVSVKKYQCQDSDRGDIQRKKKEYYYTKQSCWRSTQPCWIQSQYWGIHFKTLNTQTTWTATNIPYKISSFICRHVWLCSESVIREMFPVIYILLAKWWCLYLYFSTPATAQLAIIKSAFTFIGLHGFQKHIRKKIAKYWIRITRDLIHGQKWRTSSWAKKPKLAWDSDTFSVQLFVTVLDFINSRKDRASNCMVTLIWGKTLFHSNKANSEDSVPRN